MLLGGRMVNPWAAAAFASGTLACAGALALAACTASSLDPSRGGEPRVDATEQTISICDTPHPDAGAEAGTGFHDLYRDYFGNPAWAPCAGDGHCHGGTDQPGTLATGGFVCPLPAADAGPVDPAVKTDAENTCWTTMTASGVVRPAVDPADPSGSTLYGVLRKTNGRGGIMPRAPQCAYDDVDLARIQSWISRGANND